MGWWQICYRSLLHQNHLFWWSTWKWQIVLKNMETLFCRDALRIRQMWKEGKMCPELPLPWQSQFDCSELLERGMKLSSIPNTHFVKTPNNQLFYLARLSSKYYFLWPPMRENPNTTELVISISPKCFSSFDELTGRRRQGRLSHHCQLHQASWQAHYGACKSQSLLSRNANPFPLEYHRIFKCIYFWSYESWRDHDIICADLLYHPSPYISPTHVAV